jgi:hypothetical protein
MKRKVTETDDYEPSNSTASYSVHPFLKKNSYPSPSSGERKSRIVDESNARTTNTTVQLRLDGSFFPLFSLTFSSLVQIPVMIVIPTTFFFPLQPLAILSPHLHKFHLRLMRGWLHIPNYLMTWLIDMRILSL